MAVCVLPYNAICRAAVGRFTLAVILLVGGSPTHAATPCPRIVSLAPSITETLYVLGLGEAITAVSRFDTYPPDVKNKPRVGGLYDSNVEVLLQLKAAPVVLLSEHALLERNLQALSISTLSVDHRSISGILASYKQIGRFCNAPHWQRIHDQQQHQIERWREYFSKRTRVRTLIILGGVERTAAAQDYYVSGSDGFYAEAVSLTGGHNVHTGPTGLLPAISIEQILHTDPEVIIEIRPNGTSARSAGRTPALVELFPDLTAVKLRRYHVISAPYASIPGPRFPLLLHDLARILHPEIPVRELPSFGSPQ